jgi:acyl dehydratase
MIAEPVDGLIHHEDILVGAPMAFGVRHVTREEIIDFARTYDPQIIHIDEEAARRSIVGGLCASGMHTCAMMMGMLCEGILLRSASLGSPGLDEVKWLKPVRPGDVLSVRVVCTHKRDSASRPDVGISQMTFEVLNQLGETVLSTQSNQMFRRRSPAPRPAPTKAPIASLWDVRDAPQPDPDSMHFEDRRVGEVFDVGSHTFDREQMIAFARRFDPQPFHLDEEAGRRSLFGGLAASGWHTAAHFIRLFVAYRHQAEMRLRDRGLPVATYGPSPGFKNLGWLKPVLGGDTVSFRSRVKHKVDLKSRPDRGLLVSDHQGRNQRGEIVFTYTSQILVERRTPFRPPAG